MSRSLFTVLLSADLPVQFFKTTINHRHTCNTTNRIAALHSFFRLIVATLYYGMSLLFYMHMEHGSNRLLSVPHGTDDDDDDDGDVIVTSFGPHKLASFFIISFRSCFFLYSYAYRCITFLYLLEWLV